MIVAAPDGKTIDFGDLPPDQVTAAMQKAYPPQLSEPDQLRNMVSDEPNTKYGSILPFKYNEQTQKTSLALPGSLRSVVRGTADLMDTMKGNYKPESSDEVVPGSMEQPLTADAASTLLGAATLKPTGIPKPINDSYQPVANAIVRNTGKSLQTFGRGMGARDTEALQNTAAAMKNNAGNTYNEMRDAGVVFNPNKVNKIVGSIQQAVNSPQFIPELNPKTLAIVNHIQTSGESGQLSLSDLDQYRRLLSRVGSSEDGVSAGSVRRAIDSEVTSSTGGDLQNGDLQGVQLLNKGRSDYAKASRFEEISDLLAKANGDPNRIKANLSRFIADNDNLVGYSPAEQAALRKAADTGIGENILKAFGKFGFDFSKSGTGNTVLPVISMATQAIGNPLGVPLSVGGTIARQAQKYIARGKAENALRVIEGRNTAVTDIAQTPAPPPAITLLLEGPKPAYVVNPSGAARQQSLQELSDSILGRQNAANMGMTPDISRVSNIANIRNTFDEGYRNAQAQSDAIKQQQIKEMFSANQPSINQMVGDAMNSHKDLAQATGEVPTGDLGMILLDALRKQRTQ